MPVKVTVAECTVFEVPDVKLPVLEASASELPDRALLLVVGRVPEVECLAAEDESTWCLWGGVGREAAVVGAECVFVMLAVFVVPVVVSVLVPLPDLGEDVMCDIMDDAAMVDDVVSRAVMLESGVLDEDLVDSGLDGDIVLVNAVIDDDTGGEVPVECAVAAVVAADEVDGRTESAVEV